MYKEVYAGGTGKVYYLCDGHLRLVYIRLVARHSRSWYLVLMVDHGRWKNSDLDESDAGESPSSEVTLCPV